jgi:hypothetical protein
MLKRISHWANTTNPEQFLSREAMKSLKDVPTIVGYALITNNTLAWASSK